MHAAKHTRADAHMHIHTQYTNTHTFTHTTTLIHVHMYVRTKLQKHTQNFMFTCYTCIHTDIQCTLYVFILMVITHRRIALR